MSHTTNIPKRPFSLPVAFDPLRILYGIREKWLWLLLLGIMGGAAGLAVGTKLSDNRYSVSLQLLKSEVPNTFQVSSEGEAFKPRSLSDDTLLATTYAGQVLQQTGQRLDPTRSAGEIKSMVEINKQRKTDFFYLTAHSRRSPEDAIAVVSAWAEEIMAFTSDLQRKEALSMSGFLKVQISQLEIQIKQLDQQILAFARDELFVDENIQVESTLDAMENLRMRLALAQVSLQAKGVQIEQYTREIKTQSPLLAQLKQKREELTFLRGRYTDANPLVQEKLYEIEFLEKELQETRESGKNNLEEFTGNELGNQLYLEILSLENERIQLKNEVESLEVLIAEREQEFNRLPEKSLNLTKLKNQRSSLTEAVQVLQSRLQEAEFFVSNAPGYWTIFQKPDLKDVSVSSRHRKAAVMTLAGILAGWILAIIYAFLWEITRTGLRTPLQACLAAGSLLRLHFVTGRSEEKSLLPGLWFQRGRKAANMETLREFWMTELSTFEPPAHVILFVADKAIEGEMNFWGSLLNLCREYEAGLVLIDLNESADRLQEHCLREIEVKDLAACKPGEEPVIISPRRDEINDLIPQIKELRDRGVTIMIRSRGVPKPWRIPVLRQADAWFVLNRPSDSVFSDTRYTVNIYRNFLGETSGLITIDHQYTRTVARMIHYFETSLFDLMRQKSGKNNSPEGGGA